MILERQNMEHRYYLLDLKSQDHEHGQLRCLSPGVLTNVFTSREDAKGGCCYCLSFLYVEMCAEDWGQRITEISEPIMSIWDPKWP
jgi:hypothetical protein